MSLFVKICGVTDVATAQTCVDLGADAIGFVFTSSPRRISAVRAAEIAEAIRGRIEVVAVFRTPKAFAVENVDEILRPDFVQADHEYLSNVEEGRHLPVFREGEVVPTTSQFFVYEGPISGVGQTVDLDVAAGVAMSGPMVLAGGLNPDTVAEAIERVRPAGVDVSSGVESTVGIKSPHLIAEFIEASKSAVGV